MLNVDVTNGVPSDHGSRGNVETRAYIITRSARPEGEWRVLPTRRSDA